MIKLKNILNEKQEMGGAYIEKIRLLTDRNNHTMARLELAKMVGSKQHVKFYQGVIDIQDVVGHLPKGLSDVRNDRSWIVSSCVPISCNTQHARE